MPKTKPFLQAVMESTKIQEELTEAIKVMSAKMAKSIFVGPPASGSPNPFTGLRSALTPRTHPFRTVLRYNGKISSTKHAFGHGRGRARAPSLRPDGAFWPRDRESSSQRIHQHVGAGDMKIPLRASLRKLTAVVLLASLTTGCAYDVTPTVQADTPSTAAPIYDFIRIGPTRPSDAPQPTVRPKVIPVATPKPTARPRALQSLAHALSGQATWYRWHVGHAAAGPLLRQALGVHWRGHVVTVCARSCIRVTLTDWCTCHPSTRLIDLDDRSFAKLAPTSQGIVKVTIKW